jgi:hypothetical protein
MRSGIIIGLSLIKASANENSITIYNDSANWHVACACSRLGDING